MIDKTKIFNWTGFLVLNALAVLFVIGLQFLYYGTVPAINPRETNKKAAAIQATTDFNWTLIFELTIVAVIISIINYFYFRKVTQRPMVWTLVFLLAFVLITGLSLTHFSVDYINKFVK